MSNPIEHKLFHLEIEPSAKNWDAISNALDEQVIPYADRLYHFEQTPSTELWNAIVPELDNTTEAQPAKIIPFYKRYSQGFKYVAAASILVIVAITIALFVNKDAASNEVALQPAIKQQKNNQTLPNKETPNSVVIAGPNVPQFSDKNQVIPSADKNLTQQPQFAGRYVTMADDEGKKVRLSKKAYNVFNCAENAAAINYALCKENIQAMQQKMSASLLSPAGDFAGLIDMIKTLEENK